MATNRRRRRRLCHRLPRRQCTARRTSVLLWRWRRAAFGSDHPSRKPARWDVHAPRRVTRVRRVRLCSSGAHGGASALTARASAAAARL
eukprot:6762749-Prymnesium_polylepis.1